VDKDEKRNCSILLAKDLRDFSELREEIVIWPSPREQLDKMQRQSGQPMTVQEFQGLRPVPGEQASVSREQGSRPSVYGRSHVLNRVPGPRGRGPVRLATIARIN
jgi:hypothetical protein